MLLMSLRSQMVYTHHQNHLDNLSKMSTLLSGWRDVVIPWHRPPPTARVLHRLDIPDVYVLYNAYALSVQILS